MKKVVIFTILILVFAGFGKPLSIFAQNNEVQREVKYKAKITSLKKDTCPEEYGKDLCYYFQLEILNGKRKGENVESFLGEQDDEKLKYLDYKEGDIVYLVETNIAGETGFYVKEPIRISALSILTVTFILIVIIVGGLQGITSLIGLAVSFIAIRFITIPMMLHGSNPIIASLIGGSIILTVSIYLSHGFSKKTTIALAGTLIALIITTLLGFLFTYLTQLTGFSTDESSFLLDILGRELDMRGILLASLIIGAIGVLDDTTVNQVSIILELFKANPHLPWQELFHRSMKVGRDHIASMVNTLVLAYTGTALPLIMLFIAVKASFEEILNYELISEEIVRTLVGSIGLILSVPITSLLASLIIDRSQINVRSRRVLS